MIKIVHFYIALARKKDDGSDNAIDPNAIRFSIDGEEARYASAHPYYGNTNIDHRGIQIPTWKGGQNGQKNPP